MVRVVKISPSFPGTWDRNWYGFVFQEVSTIDENGQPVKDNRLIDGRKLSRKGVRMTNAEYKARWKAKRKERERLRKLSE